MASIVYGYKTFTLAKKEVEREKKASEWVTTDFSSASWNSKALNTIFFFSFVDHNQLRLISTCKQRSIVKSSKLQMITLEFE